MQKTRRAFVLGGGGARGAFQVGALRALLEANIQPAFTVGTSIGAVNAVFLALHGFNVDGIDGLERAWRDSEQAELLPENYLWLTVRALFDRGGGHLEGRLQQFLRDHGLTPDLRFKDLEGVPAFLVASDLTNGRPLLYGEDPDAYVMEAVLASAALPPWVHPRNSQGRLLIDGGAVSNLPIEAALSLGAREIIAMDLSEPRGPFGDAPLFGTWINKLLFAVQQRQLELELALAAALEVPVKLLRFRADPPVPVWDFSRTDVLIALGYAQTKAEVAGWEKKSLPRLQSLRERLANLGVWTGRRSLLRD